MALSYRLERRGFCTAYLMSSASHFLDLFLSHEKSPVQKISAVPYGTSSCSETERQCSSKLCPIPIILIKHTEHFLGLFQVKHIHRFCTVGIVKRKPYYNFIWRIGRCISMEFRWIWVAGLLNNEICYFFELEDQDRAILQWNPEKHHKLTFPNRQY